MGHDRTHAPQQNRAYSISSSARASSVGGTSKVHLSPSPMTARAAKWMNGFAGARVEKY